MKIAISTNHHYYESTYFDHNQLWNAFQLKHNKDKIAVACYDWSEKITNELGWTDNLSVEAYAEEYANWLREQN